MISYRRPFSILLASLGISVFLMSMSTMVQVVPSNFKSPQQIMPSFLNEFELFSPRFGIILVVVFVVLFVWGLKKKRA
ncbi:MAG: hypothetical protein ACOYW3_07500 [Bacteroidota bacterium]